MPKDDQKTVRQFGLIPAAQASESMRLFHRAGFDFRTAFDPGDQMRLDELRKSLQNNNHQDPVRCKELLLELNAGLTGQLYALEASRHSLVDPVPLRLNDQVRDALDGENRLREVKAELSLFDSELIKELQLEIQREGLLNQPIPGRTIKSKRRPPKDPGLIKLRQRVAQLANKIIHHIDVCRALDREGIKTPPGTRWHHLTWQEAYHSNKSAVAKWISTNSKSKS